MGRYTAIRADGREPHDHHRESHRVGRADLVEQAAHHSLQRERPGTGDNPDRQQDRSVTHDHPDHGAHPGG